MRLTLPVALALSVSQTVIAGVAVWKIRSWDAAAEAERRSDAAAAASPPAPTAPAHAAANAQERKPEPVTAVMEERALREARAALDRARALAYDEPPPQARKAPDAARDAGVPIPATTVAHRASPPDAPGAAGLE